VSAPGGRPVGVARSRGVGRSGGMRVLPARRHPAEKRVPSAPRLWRRASADSVKLKTGETRARLARQSSTGPSILFARTWGGTSFGKGDRVAGPAMAWTVWKSRTAFGLTRRGDHELSVKNTSGSRAHRDGLPIQPVRRRADRRVSPRPSRLGSPPARDHRAAGQHSVQQAHHLPPGTPSTMAASND